MCAIWSSVVVLQKINIKLQFKIYGQVSFRLSSYKRIPYGSDELSVSKKHAA